MFLHRTSALHHRLLNIMYSTARGRFAKKITAVIGISMRLLIVLFLILAGCGKGGFRVDSDRTLSLISSVPPDPLPTGVEIFRTGPKVGKDDFRDLGGSSAKEMLVFS